MRLTIAAVGRMKAGPEKMLVDDYLSRASATGRRLGFGPVSVVEIDERKVTSSNAQTSELAAVVPSNGSALWLDERGETLDSRAFSKRLARFRDDGCANLVCLIGGADGHHRPGIPAPAYCLSLGPLVWPHMLVRVMLAEQIYRAVSIEAGAPYHRD